MTQEERALEIQLIQATLEIVSEGTVRPNKHSGNNEGSVVRDAIDAKPLIKCLYDKLADLHGVDLIKYKSLSNFRNDQ